MFFNYDDIGILDVTPFPQNFSDSSRNPGNAPEFIQIALDPGQYYILVNSTDKMDTDYELTVSAKFIVDDEVIGDPNLSMRDVEFDEVGNQIAWQDLEGNLWVAPVNKDGDFMLEEATFLDSSLAPISQTLNGPEVWLVDIDPQENFYRKVSNDGNLHRDPDPFVAETGAFIYYSEKTPEGNFIVHKTDTGLVNANIPPNQLQFNLNQSNNLLSLTDAWVYDENGSDDLNKVDFWILNPQGEWTDLSDVTNFTPWSGDERWGSFNYSLDLSQYSPGSYTLWAQANDQSGATSNAVSQTFLADGAGNTLATAREIGLLDAKPFSQTFSDRVGPSDTLDYYRFELLSNSEFQLTLDGLTADANVFLLDSTGKMLNYSLNKNSELEFLNQSLNPGTYYILVRPNKNIPNAATNYILTISAQYIVDDILVSDPEYALLDPEFEPYSNQVVWQSSSNNDNGVLQVAPIDPLTGSLLLDPERIAVVDNGLPRLGVQNGRSTNNGPEWLRGDRSKIIYTKQIDSKIYLRQAEWTGLEWTTNFIVDSQGNPIEGSSVLTHQDYNFGLVSYLTTMDISGQKVQVSAWTDLNTPGIGGILPGERRRWVEGERSILLTQEISGYEQIFKYEVDSGKLTQLTFEPIDKVGDAYMFRAPDYNNELILMAAETTIDNSLTANQFSIYRQLNGQWTKIKTVVSSIPDLPVIIGQEPFTFNGHSYVSFSISKSGTNGKPIYDGTQQVWFASVGIEQGDDLLRRVSSDQGTANSTKVPDPEPFVTPDDAFIYYSTSEIAGGVSTIHRADTGLGTDTGLVIPVISDFPSITGNLELVNQSP